MVFKVENVTPQKAELITPKEIYQTLWRCRDFEISHLWQRSVFLTAFLLLVYTGYGLFVVHILEMPTGVSNDIFTIYAIVGLFILSIGIVLSQLWIMMGKGSKAWYERYEDAIFALEHDERFVCKKVTQIMSNDNMMHGNLPLPDSIDLNVFSTNAGAFSPSRINIFIGQFSWFILNVGFIVQSVLMALSGKLAFFQNKICCWILYSILFLIVFNTLSYFILRRMVESKTLQDKS